VYAYHWSSAHTGTAERPSLALRGILTFPSIVPKLMFNDHVKMQTRHQTADILRSQPQKLGLDINIINSASVLNGPGAVVDSPSSGTSSMTCLPRDTFSETSSNLSSNGVYEGSGTISRRGENIIYIVCCHKPLSRQVTSTRGLCIQIYCRDRNGNRSRHISIIVN